MNEIFDKGKEYFRGQAYNWTLKLPTVQQIIKDSIREHDYWHERLRNQEIISNNLREEIKQKDKLIEELREQANPYGKPGYPKEDHDLSWLGVTSNVVGSYNKDGKDGYDQFDVKNPTPRMKEEVATYLKVDSNKLKNILEKDNTEEAWTAFNKIRMIEATTIEHSGLGILAWTISNRNRVEAEVNNRVPLTLYSQMEPRYVDRVTNRRVLGESNRSDDYQYHPLPNGVEYALVKRYPFGRIKIEFYNDQDELINPSIEDNDLLVEEPKELTLWESTKKFFGFN